MSYYEIPEKITEEETFMYNLVKKFNETGMSCGTVMGIFYSVIENMKKENVSDELVKNTEMVYDVIEGILKEYMSISKYSLERWESLGKPLSLEGHLEKKKRLEKEEEKLEYERSYMPW